MNIDKLKEILISHNLFVKETKKNIVSCCIFCGDHKNPKKRGHLYVSVIDNNPVCHCFLCNKSTTIRNLLKEISLDSDVINSVITEDEQRESINKQQSYTVNKVTVKKFNLPLIDKDSFLQKRLYIKKRTCNGIEPEYISNLIFDFKNFFYMNDIKPVESGMLTDIEYEFICTNFVGFLSKNHTTIYCRNIDTNEKEFKFRKIVLQENKFGLLDYWCLYNSLNSSLVVLSEGNFNILSEYCHNSLKIKDKVRLYASGNSFSYDALIKSICYEEDLYQCDVIILSDADKFTEHYYDFILNNSHIIRTLQIWGNERGKDFGEFPIKPFLYKDVKTEIMNKIKSKSDFCKGV